MFNRIYAKYLARLNESLVDIFNWDFWSLLILSFVFGVQLDSVYFAIYCVRTFD